MGPRVLVAGRIRLDHVPGEQREHLVETRGTGQIGVVEVGVAAVAEPDVGRYQGEPGLVGVLHTIAVPIEERTGVKVRLPLIHGNLPHIAAGRVGVDEPHRRRKTVHQHVVPLVEDRDAPVAIGKAREPEGPIGLALGEREIFAVRISDAHVALGEGEAVVGAAAVESLIRRAAHALARDHSGHRIAAVGARDVGVGAGAHAAQAAVDDRRVGKADRHVVARRPVLLEEVRLADPQERIVRLLAIQGIGLQPLLASGNPVGPGRGHHAVPSRHQVGDHGLARERRQSRAVRLVLRAGHDHARDAFLRGISGNHRRNRAGVEPRGRIDLARQAVRQRHVEHVVGHLSGGIAGAAGVVKQDDIEAAQTGLVGRNHVDSAAGILLFRHRDTGLEVLLRGPRVVVSFSGRTKSSHRGSVRVGSR